MKRNVLVLGAAALVLIGCIIAAGCVSDNTAGQTKIYDFEHHYIVPEFFDYLKDRTDYPLLTSDGILYRENCLLTIFCPSIGKNSNASTYEELTDLGALRLSILDNAGISTAMVSSGQGIEELSKEDAVRLAQITNNRVAEAVKKYPGRFLGTITLPTPYVEESITELERAVNELGLQYWHTHSNYNGEYLYEEKFEPIFAKCAELNVPFYIHPNYPCDDYLTNGGVLVSGAVFGFGVDVMKTSLLLTLNGVFDRYPNLQMIIGHMAEFYPYTIDRMDNRLRCSDAYASELKCNKTLAEYFANKNIFMTTSGIYDPAVVTCAIETIGIDNILFATDYPYEDVKGEVEFIKSLPISNEDKDKIFYKNAEKYIIKDRS
ncbi:MAG TPA: amidohydrolase family protein [Methanocorpusculum sp.]|nr:amidohydrolase family protein [Methanocorpusculum sp.]